MVPLLDFGTVSTVVFFSHFIIYKNIVPITYSSVVLCLNVVRNIYPPFLLNEK